MNKTLKLYGILLIIILVVLALLQLSKKDITDWRKNFDPNSKTPFGLYIFDQETRNIFKNKLSSEIQSPYEYYNHHKGKKPHNIVVVQKFLDDESWTKVIGEVSNGSDLMLITEDIYGVLIDTLKITSPTTINFEESNVLYFTDQKFQKDSLVIDKLPSRKGYSIIGKEGEILGFTKADKKNKDANFVKYRFGKGNIYIHTEPLFITNYYLLHQGGKVYAENTFSYLQDRETIWFKDNSEFVSSSIMRFVLSKPALKYAWWLLFGGLLLFVIFNAKRKQRVVPVIEPLQNKSVEFVKSIGNLYLQEGDFHDMMAKKAQYFLHRVRLDLLIDTQDLDEVFARRLHLKTGASFDEIKEAVDLITRGMDPYANVMREDLTRMNVLLDKILAK